MYCDGSPDTTRTDILNELVKANLPKADMTGACEAGYYCHYVATHGRQKICLPG
jgi:hypothetical protein